MKCNFFALHDLHNVLVIWGKVLHASICLVLDTQVANIDMHGWISVVVCLSLSFGCNYLWWKKALLSHMSALIAWLWNMKRGYIFSLRRSSGRRKNPSMKKYDQYTSSLPVPWRVEETSVFLQLLCLLCSVHFIINKVIRKILWSK